MSKPNPTTPAHGPTFEEGPRLKPGPSVKARKIWAFHNIIKISPGPTLQILGSAWMQLFRAQPINSLIFIILLQKEIILHISLTHTHTYTKNVWEKPNLQINNDARVFLADSIEDHANIVALIQLDFIMNQ